MFDLDLHSYLESDAAQAIMRALQFIYPGTDGEKAQIAWYEGNFPG